MAEEKKTLGGKAITKIVIGAILLLGSVSSFGTLGDVSGPQGDGFIFGVLGMFVLSCWLIYSGFKNKKKNS